MNPLLKSGEVAYHLSDAGARLWSPGTTSRMRRARAANEAGAELILVAPGEFDELLGSSRPVDEVADRDDDDPP